MRNRMVDDFDLEHPVRIGTVKNANTSDHQAQRAGVGVLHRRAVHSFPSGSCHGDACVKHERLGSGLMIFQSHWFAINVGLRIFCGICGQAHASGLVNVAASCCSCFHFTVHYACNTCPAVVSVDPRLLPERWQP